MMIGYDPLREFPPNLIPTPGPRDGELGIGVGVMEPPILERGEDPAGHFRSVVWFPYGAEAEAREFADANGYVVRRGVRL